jgi:hypothetical protein
MRRCANPFNVYITGHFFKLLRWYNYQFLSASCRLLTDRLSLQGLQKSVTLNKCCDTDSCNTDCCSSSTDSLSLSNCKTLYFKKCDQGYKP